jgi:hypothetical protein
VQRIQLLYKKQIQIANEVIKLFEQIRYEKNLWLLNWFDRIDRKEKTEKKIAPRED